MITEDITVVIPAYNSEKFIGRTIESVLSQTVLPKSIIVVDDCSQDETLEILDTVAQSACVPINVLRRNVSSGGPAVPLNEGISQARTEWIALLDHDDEMLPQKLEKQINAIKISGEKFVFSDWTLCNEKSGTASAGLKSEQLTLLKERGTAVSHEAFVLDRRTALQEQILDPGLVQSCSNILFHKDLYTECGPFDVERSTISDYVFKLKVAADYDSVFIPEPLFVKHQHDRNLFDTTVSVGLMCEIFEMGIYSLKKNPRCFRNDPEFKDRLLRYLESYCVFWRQEGFLKESLWLAWQIPTVCGMNSKSAKPFFDWLRYCGKYKLRFKRIPNT